MVESDTYGVVIGVKGGSRGSWSTVCRNSRIHPW